jgi:hypothetical protein
VTKYASTPYAVRFLLSRSPAAAAPELREWASELGRMDNGQLRSKSQVLQVFLARTPNHLFANDVRQHLIAVSSALGDLGTLEKTVVELEMRKPDSRAAKEARALLVSHRQGQVQ